MQLDPREAYKLMTGFIVPRPIAWISTEAPDGTRNLAPFSFFNGVPGSVSLPLFGLFPEYPEGRRAPDRSAEASAIMPDTGGAIPGFSPAPLLVPGAGFLLLGAAGLLLARARLRRRSS